MSPSMEPRSSRPDPIDRSSGPRTFRNPLALFALLTVLVGVLIVPAGLGSFHWAPLPLTPARSSESSDPGAALIREAADSLAMYQGPSARLAPMNGSGPVSGNWSWGNGSLSFLVGPTMGPAPLVVHFNTSVSCSNCTYWNVTWSVGPNSSSTSQAGGGAAISGSFTCAVPGVYNLSLSFRYNLSTGGFGGHVQGIPITVLNGSATGNWTDLSAGIPTAPPPRQLQSMAYDAADQYVVLFGGGTGFGPGQQWNDTWSYSNGSWTQLHPLQSPEARRSASLAYDSADGYLVLFGGLYPGGSTSSSTGYQDTWTFLHGQWTNRTAPTITANNTPSVRWNAQMAYDEQDGYVVLFGGCNQLSCASSTNDTWSYSGGTWSDLTSTAGAAPPVRGTGMMTYYPPDHAVLLYGGALPNQTTYDDTWEFSAGSWTQLHPAASPGSRGDSFLAYDNATSQLLLFGGLRYTQPTVSYAVGDTWLYRNGTWINQTPNESVAPSIRWGLHHAGVYDAADGYCLLFGGADDIGNLLGDTWIYRTVHSGAPSGGLNNSSGGSNNSTGSGGGHGTSGPPPPAPLGGFANESAQVGSAPLEVVFSATPAGGVAPYHYSWNFGDGSVGGDVATVTHTYLATGHYEPVVSITDSRGVRVSWVLPQVIVSSGSVGTTSPPTVPPTAPSILGTGLLLGGSIALIGIAALLIGRRRWSDRMRREGEELLSPALSR